MRLQQIGCYEIAEVKVNDTNGISEELGNEEAHEYHSSKTNSPWKPGQHHPRQAVTWLEALAEPGVLSVMEREQAAVGRGQPFWQSYKPVLEHP